MNPTLRNSSPTSSGDPKVIHHSRPSLVWYAGLVSAFWALLLVDLVFRLSRYRRVCSLLVATSPRPDPDKVDIPRARAYGRLVNKAARLLPWVTCLRRSLVVWWMLRWERIPSTLEIGVQTANSTTSHSWVAHHGEVINDAPDIAQHYPLIFSDVLDPEKVVSRS